MKTSSYIRRVQTASKAVWHTCWVECRAHERIIPALFIAIVLIALPYKLLLTPPQVIVKPVAVIVPEGQSLAATAYQLKQAHLVRSGLLLDLAVRALGGNRRVEAGTYFFPVEENTLTIAKRFVTGGFDLHAVRVVIREGMTAREIGDLLNQKLQPFDEQQFLAVALPREGYLFPDTYLFFPAQNPQVVEATMEQDFNKHAAALAAQAAALHKPTQAMVTMASILVGEARTDTDRRIVAGILWKRIQIGLPLQVDAPFSYVMDKPLTELTHDDLKIDSPYNTYKNKGLPPTPINNPGEEALAAAVAPLPTAYLYYLSDKNGVMHYSATFSGHEAQIREYL